MNDARDFCLDISHAHASLTRKLDDELGTLHGLGYNDFVLLTLLSRTRQAGMAMGDLAHPMGVQMSVVIRQLIPPEKTGMLRRDPYVGTDGRRHVALLPGGRKVFQGATVTAAALCAELVGGMPAAGVAGAHGLLRDVRDSTLLAL